MRKLIIAIVALAAVSCCTSWTYADDNDNNPGARKGKAGMENVDGKVLEYDAEKGKLAIEVEVEAKKPTVVVIFLLNKDTRIRKAEHALTLDDLRKGNTVTVTYKPADKDKKGDLPLAIYIRVWDDRNKQGNPGNPGGPGGGGPGGHHH